MRFTSFANAAALTGLLMALAPTSQAATSSFTTTEYTVSYDDSTTFGGIVGNGSGSDGITQTLSFFWTPPLAGSTGHDPVVKVLNGTATFDIPSFTLTAASGYEFSELKLTLGGSVFNIGSPSAASFGALVYTGPDASFGTWTLTGTLTSGTFGSYTFSGGTLTLSAPAGAIFATEGPEVQFTVSAVPEPEALGLALAGAGVLWVAGRRRQRQRG